MPRPIFKIDPRLKLCADFLRTNAKIADVGTDHAYLPIWLAKNHLIKKAIALDINEGPLQCAKSNIIKYHVEDIVTTRLSDGLCNVSESEVDDIIIAGMGGELIKNIILKAKFLKNADKRLILQPMSDAESLRRFLFEYNFEIIDEKAAVCDNRVYSAMLVQFTNAQIAVSNLYPYIGKLENNLDENAINYIKKEIIHLKNRINGLMTQNNYAHADELLIALNDLNKLIERSENR